ncbi:MAG TPA: PAS domain-containing sensor histidine kinase [Gemmatimonadaceae bacterium]|nr:PAS domain-containing sensor histidine kinase [Gemmatimonadaceae bacterium]
MTASGEKQETRPLGVSAHVEKLYRLLIDSVRDYAIFALDTGGHIVSWNAGAQRFKGYLPHEIIGKHFSVFYPPDEIARGKPAWELEVATRDGRVEDEGWRIRKDGTRFWANVVITALHDSSGTLIGFGKVTRDLTERREAQERAIDAARRLAEVEAANRAKSQFLASMSHELRTPLNAIGGYAELIEMGLGGMVTPQQREYLSRIRTSQQHLLRIINDLLNYSRIEAGKLVYEKEPVEATRVLDNVLGMVAPQAASRGIALERGDCADEVVAVGDRVKIEQIVLNLLSNALKFTPPGGRVTASCGRAGDKVFITVRDNGPGIPSDAIDQIFEPFVQLGRSLSSGHEGAGLGLAISRDLARAMQGELVVESIPGEGAAFTLTMPTAAAPAA